MAKRKTGQYTASPVIIDNDLTGLSLAEVLERLEAGRCGHAAVMAYIGTESYYVLVDTMHYNGRMMPGHRKMIITPETRELLRQLPRRTAADTDAKHDLENDPKD
jgi:hypothetical protein